MTTSLKSTEDVPTTLVPTVSNTKTDKSATLHSSSTLFVRNIPFEVDKDTLQAFFADFGPLQSCFLVSKRESGESTHAGYGFVQFALKEDACRAVEELNKRHGVKKIQGRRLKVELALRKHLKDIKDKDAVPKNKPSKEQNTGDGDALVTVHVLVRGGALSEKMLVARLRRAAGKPASITQVTPTSYTVCYSKEAEAVRVVKKLHSKPFQINGNSSTCTLSCVIVTTALKRHRIILRNLPFDTTLDTLAPFDAFGHIVGVELPRQPGTESFRGFAFIQYSTRAEAEQAIANGNGMKIERRPVAVDWALSKKDFRGRGNSGEE